MKVGERVCGDGCPGTIAKIYRDGGFAVRWDDDFHTDGEHDQYDSSDWGDWIGPLDD